MLRRLTGTLTPKVATAASGTTAVARRHLEPMSVFYLSSWTAVWWYSFFFWMPVLWVDMIVPSFVYNKLPLIHFIQEKRAEQKLRRVLDETYTSWTTEIDPAQITDAVVRTF
ncbi:hypothetical protein STCU_02845 [Strigomonas culicis]|uniref:Uncharacterized protein n=1 Tax=Strigomonas culicis TaxID=28005 RepID=S9W925_9TRYP|nr:hypothetical protein STCU_02845 [Strigomonas culicis]|eukprot:EPY32370.1 hypothetical protein STCU_02845 [Strigomonas culicis]